MQKYLIFSLIALAVGIVIGGLSVAGYYNAKTTEYIVEEEVNKGVCQIDLSGDSDEGDLVAASAYLKFKDIKRSFIPTGVPDTYGQELDISFDEVQDAIDKVKIFGSTYGSQKIVLTGNDLNRYIDIGLSISCEYCCGVPAITREDGEAACGCAHSQMMRGLTAYLITNHPEMSNAQILGELEKWKITYFPKQTLSKELNRLEESGDAGIKEILREFPDFLPQMVGGC